MWPQLFQCTLNNISLQCISHLQFLVQSLHFVSDRSLRRCDVVLCHIRVEDTCADDAATVVGSTVGRTHN